MSYETASIMRPYLEDVKLLGANLFAGYVRSHVKGILLSDRVPFAMPARCGFMTPGFFLGGGGGARPVTKPLAGRAGARIVGTIGGTAHRPRPSNSAV